MRMLGIGLVLALGFGAAPLAAQVAPAVPAPEEEAARLRERILELEALVERLDARIGALQDLLRMAAPDADPVPASFVGDPGALPQWQPWHDAARWRRLQRGVTSLQAIHLLGTPGQVIVTGDRTYWYYPDRSGGWVRLDHDAARVEAWGEPGSAR